jgi:hypothetical protein
LVLVSQVIIIIIIINCSSSSRWMEVGGGRGRTAKQALQQTVL